MANEKISAMPTATLPLAGTELVPVVQSGANKQIPANDVLNQTGTIVAAVTQITFNAGGNTGLGADVSLLGADVTAGQHSAELDFITGNATGAGGITGPLFLGSGNSAADVSGLVSLGSGTAGTTSGEADLFTGSGATTGAVNITTGNASAGNSGDVTLQTGTASGTRGSIVLDGPILKTGDGQAYTDGTVGWDIEVGNVNSTGGAGVAAKAVYIQAGIAVTLGQGGDAFIQAGDGGSTGGNGGLAGMQAGQSTAAGATGGEAHVVGGQAAVAGANGGGVLIVSGQGLGSGNSGNITIQTGTVAAGTRGNVIILVLPTADPHVVGALWIDAAAGRVIKSSNG